MNVSTRTGLCLLAVAVVCGCAPKITSKRIGLPDGDTLLCTYENGLLVRTEQFSKTNGIKLTVRRTIKKESEAFEFTGENDKRIGESVIEEGAVSSTMVAKGFGASGEWNAEKLVFRWGFTNGESVLVISNFFPHGGKKGQKIFGPQGVELYSR